MITPSRTTWASFPVYRKQLLTGAVSFAISIALPAAAAPETALPPEPRILSVKPSVGYPNDKNKLTLTITGDHFARKGQGDNVLIIDGKEVPVDWSADPNRPNDPRGTQDSDYQLVFTNISLPSIRGAADVQLRVGAQRSQPVRVVFSAVPRSAPMAWALGVVGGLVIIAVLAVALGKRRHAIGDKRYGLLAAFFLDQETDTYSLSKLQFYLWTFVALFGYAYLVLARSLVQGFFSLPPPPQNMPSVVLLSAATTAIASGITNSRGPKGAGEVYPSLADFVSTGGMIVPERFQFFAWTLLGVASFAAMILFSDPGGIDKLPDLPDGFLYLMGASSAGYLGGKFARKPGPIIDEIRASIGSLILEIRGRNLSTSPSFQIDGVDLSYDRVGAPAPSVPLVTAGNRLEIVELEPGVSGPAEFARILRLTIDSPKKEWVQTNTDRGNPVLALVNSDGQRAAWPFTPPQAAIDAANPTEVSVKEGVSVSSGTSGGTISAKSGA